MRELERILRLGFNPVVYYYDDVKMFYIEQLFSPVKGEGRTLTKAAKAFVASADYHLALED